MSKRELRQKLSKETLYRLYRVERRSLEDIAKDYGASRVAIMNYCNALNIPLRTKSQARIEAQKQGKLPQQFFDINEDFFNNWSHRMAYVLGLIITDGCISKAGTVALSINDKDLLEKVKKAISSKHKITLSKRQRGLYNFKFARKNMAKALKKFGIIPRKSLIVKFPEVPKDYLPDFVRGVFDGDGSVFYAKKSEKAPLRTKFLSGSKSFILDLKKSLESLGMPNKKLYCESRQNPVYYIRYCHKDSLILFKILYEGLKSDLYLKRKYDRFKAVINNGKSA